MERRLGLTCGLAAYLLWGTLPLFWPLLEPANPVEILAARVVFSVLTIAVVLAVQHRIRSVAALGRPAISRLAMASALIAVNWGSYIWGVNNHHVVEISLGYFVNPLMTVALGVIVLHERLRAVQWAALALGATAVAVLTVDYGRLPWLALTLAGSFGTYGLIKKRMAVSPAAGLLVESAALLVPAIVVLGALAVTARATWIGPQATAAHLALLSAAGPLTAIPMLFFAAAANRLPLSTLGLLQYLAPVLQFLIGVLVRHEPMTAARFGGFALVWAALVVLTADAVRHRGPARTTIADPPVADVVPEPT
jgi:chloramphenicol-sensitive protein RarD